MIASKLLTLLVAAAGVSALDLDTSSLESICNAASLIIKGEMDYYEGIRPGGTVGMFQQPYYWWQAGEAFGGLLNAWFYCQNDTFEQIIYDALVHQTGTNYNYMPSNISSSEGNDDQAFWGFTVMDAVERNFTNPTGNTPGWLAMVQAVYNTMYARWDSSTCGGGLRWQILSYNSGYKYKNTIANGGLFLILARLARYTENETYVDTAEKVWDWIDLVGFLNTDKTDWVVYDGSNVDENCTVMDTNLWSYNNGALLAGCAYLYNFTQEQKWLDRVDKLWSSTWDTFFANGIMYERTCQNSTGGCNTDQRLFKLFFLRCLAVTAVLVNLTADAIFGALETSAAAAALLCSGGSDGHTCGLAWTENKWDGMYGLGEQMCALEVITLLLAKDRPAPYTSSKGGSSEGNVNAGTGDSYDDNVNKITITGADKAGAGVLTAVVLAFILGGGIWMAL